MSFTPVLRYPLPQHALCLLKASCVFLDTIMASSFVARRLAIPLACLVPVVAIIFAFALGPSPEKYVADFCAHRGSAEERRILLERAGSQAVPALVRRIVQPSMCHRSEAIAYLGDVRAATAMEALRKIADSSTEAPEIRARAEAAAAAIAKEVASRR